MAREQGGVLRINRACNRTIWNRYGIFMTTLTITDAKKNLGKWLKFAANGGEVAIISGAEIIALRKVPVQAADYSWIEYGVTGEDVTAYERKATAEHDRLKVASKLEFLTTDDLRQKREKAALR